MKIKAIEVISAAAAMLMLTACGNGGSPAGTGIPDAADLIGTAETTASETTAEAASDNETETSSETTTTTAAETVILTSETDLVTADSNSETASEVTSVPTDTDTAPAKTDMTGYPTLEPLSREAEQKIKEDHAAFKGLRENAVESIFIRYYYGTYNGCEVVMCSSPVSVSGEEIYEIIGEFSFHEDIMLHKDGTFISLADAYENGYLNNDDLKAIAYYDSIKPINTPDAPSPEEDFITPELLSWEAEQQLKADYSAYKDWTDLADTAYVEGYYGTYNGCEAVVMWSTELMFNEMIKEVSMGEYTIMLPSGSFDLTLHKDGSFIDIADAYNEGYLTDGDIKAIANTKPERYLPDSRPEPLTADAEAVLCEDYAEYATSETETFYADDVLVLEYLGTYDGCEVVIMICRDLPYSPAPKMITVNGYDMQVASEDMDIMMHRDSSFIDIRFAYESGYLTDDDIVTIRRYHEFF